MLPFVTLSYDFLFISGKTKPRNSGFIKTCISAPFTYAQIFTNTQGHICIQKSYFYTLLSRCSSKNSGTSADALKQVNSDNHEHRHHTQTNVTCNEANNEKNEKNDKFLEQFGHSTQVNNKEFYDSKAAQVSSSESDKFWKEFGKGYLNESFSASQKMLGVSTEDGTQLSHTDDAGKLKMVDVSDKSSSSRVAVATGVVYLGEPAFGLVKENKLKKGDVTTVAQIAGISGAKKTSDLIPLCHNIPLSKVHVNLELCNDTKSVRVTALAKSYGQTGVEMEALTAVAVAALTVYDMCKAVSKDIVIGDIKLEHKSGGKSGEYNRS